MDARRLALGLYCHFHCSERSCRECHEESPDGKCPDTKELHGFMRNVTSKLYDRYLRDEFESDIEIDELVNILENSLNEG